MNLGAIDISIIVGYLILTVLIGYLISHKASKSLKNYFLGGNSIKWYFLGISNASGMFDITGTMWTVTILFVYGLKSVFLPWLWPVWNQIFLMVFMSIWLRRSNVMTGAEWLKTRFGDNRGNQLSHIIVVTFAVVAVIGYIVYDFEGIGKFAEIFFPWKLDVTLLGHTISSANMYAIIVMGLTTIYVVKGGMYSVVFTEVMQFVIMTVSCALVAIIAYKMVTPEQINAAVPAGWKSLSFGWKLDLDWSNYIPAVNEKIRQDGYILFRALMGMMICKGVLVSIAGPIPGYDMQRILATESPRDAAKMSSIVNVVLMIPRFFMISSLVVIALVYLTPQFNAMGSNIDFEIVLPYALNSHIPAGAKGLLLAGLVAAFMSTFAATVNAGPAYIVNDIYKKYINPHASERKYVRMSYIVSFCFVIIGISFGFFASNIDQVLNWIVGALFGGYIAANFLKWIWWRFNGFGYFYGMLVGLIISFIMFLVFPQVKPIYAFPFIFLFSFIASVVGSLLTEPEEDDVLISFYENVRPWGFWKPVYKKLKERKPNALPNQDFARDMTNCAVGIVWQTSLVLLPIYFMIKDFLGFAIAVGVAIATSVLLYFFWYKKIKNYPDDVVINK